MNEDFEKLQQIGAQKIYEQTHITRVNIENILSKTFDQLEKVKFYGFISILEREYSLNLEELKEEYNDFYELNHADEEHLAERTYEFQAKKKSKTINIFIVVVISIGILASIYLFFTQKTSTQNEIPLVNNTQIDKAAGLIEKNITTSDSNATEINATDANVSVVAPILPKSVVPTKFEIITTAKLWLGITDLDTMKQTQTVVAKSLDLNATKNYLLSLGHGMIKIDLGDKNISFPQRGKVWLHYKDGVVKTLTHDQYKKLGKGKTW